MRYRTSKVLHINGRALVALLFAIIFLTLRPANAAITQDEQRILSGISANRMMQTIERLCCDQFAGRQAGTSGENAARDYLVTQYTSAGLSPLQEFPRYKQPLTMRYSLVKSNEDIKATLSYKVAGRNGGASRLRSFSYPSYNGRGGLDIKSKVVFVGYGIYDPASGHDDYSGVNVTGKVVMWLPGQPEGVNLAGKSTGVQKMLAAYQHGAAACLIYKPAGVNDEWGTNTGFAGAIADFPYIAVDDQIASELMAPARVNLGSLLHGSSSKQSIGAAGAYVRLRITPVCDPNRSTYNIVATLPGTDLKDEVVLVGAHYDHLGSNGHANIFRGADDNASGTSVVLDVARSIRASGLVPRRTIVFCSWTGEECGLVGSNYFAANPPFPLGEIVSNLELDMVGTGTPGVICTTGAAAYPSHYKNLSTSASDLGVTLQADTVIGASDHLAFTRKHVPSSLIYAAGNHPNYHTIRDIPAGINPKILESTARLTALSAWRAANL